MLVEALLVLLVVVRVLMKPVRLLGLEAMRVLGRLLEDMSMLTDAVKVLVEAVRAFRGLASTFSGGESSYGQTPRKCL